MEQSLGFGACWQYLKLHNLFLATFEGNFFMFFRQKKTIKDFVAKN